MYITEGNANTSCCYYIGYNTMSLQYFFLMCQFIIFESRGLLYLSKNCP